MRRERWTKPGAEVVTAVLGPFPHPEHVALLRALLTLAEPTSHEVFEAAGVEPSRARETTLGRIARAAGLAPLQMREGGKRVRRFVRASETAAAGPRSPQWCGDSPPTPAAVVSGDARDEGGECDVD
jgi:hypothetical protein